MSISGLSGTSAAGPRLMFRPPSFESLDSNGDQSITLDELKADAPGSGTAASSARAEKLFSAMDTDGNGSVTEDEKNAFDQRIRDRQAGISFLAQQMSSSSDPTAFAATDADGNGGISLDELSSTDAASGVSSDALAKVFDMMDADGDGSISEDESSSLFDRMASAAAPQGSLPNGSSAGSADLWSLARAAYASQSA